MSTRPQLSERTGRELVTLAGHTDTVKECGVLTRRQADPNGRRMTDGKLWERDGKALATLAGHTDPVMSAVFSPDGKRVLTGRGTRRQGCGIATARRLPPSRATRRGRARCSRPDGKRVLTAAVTGRQGCGIATARR